MVTIFGYGAPKSDAAAADLLKSGLRNRSMNQIEIIDTRRQSELLWDPFIDAHNYHYKIHTIFYDSWLAAANRLRSATVT